MGGYNTRGFFTIDLNERSNIPAVNLLFTVIVSARLVDHSSNLSIGTRYNSFNLELRFVKSLSGK